MKAAFFLRVSTPSQEAENQFLALRPEAERARSQGGHVGRRRRKETARRQRGEGLLGGQG